MTDIPLGMLPRAQELSAIRGRLKCERCGVPPKTVALKRYGTPERPHDPAVFERMEVNQMKDAQK
jgi:hypothetical protein